MAIFMPIDNSLQHLNFNNLLKIQTPTQNYKIANLTKSNILQKYSNDFMCKMSEEKQNQMAIKLNILNDADESCDSDLSVGQEKVEDDKSENNFDATESEVVDNNHMEDEEDNSSNASISSSFLHSTNQPPSNAIHLSTILRPNTSRLHEEIFRNSQLYAEELVRQQLAAAARLQNISETKKFPHTFEPQRSLFSSASDEGDIKLGFNSTINAVKSIENNHLQNGNNIFCNNKSAINFQNIHSHLSAISQITNSLTSSNNIKKDDNTSLSSLSRESSQSPNILFHTQQNQMHERNLKFSIDNILKADFGRRITEPLLRSAKSKKYLREEKPDRDHFNKFNAPASAKDSFSSSNDNLVPESSPSSNQLPPSSESNKSETSKGSGSSGGTVWPAWVFCTRYSDRPSSGRSPRVKKPKKPPSDKSEDEKRPRTAFSGPQLARLKHEFNENRYLTEKRRQQLSGELGLNEAQIKIWFQNKRAKIKKSTGQKNPLALQLMAQGLYNHSTVPLSKEEEEMHQLQELEGR